MHEAFLIVAIIFFVLSGIGGFWEQGRAFAPNLIPLGLAFFAASFYVAR
jgi:hypothetical protein